MCLALCPGGKKEGKDTYICIRAREQPERLVWAHETTEPGSNTTHRHRTRYQQAYTLPSQLVTMSSIKSNSTITSSELPSQPSSQSHPSKPASETSSCDDDEAFQRFLQANIAWKEEWKQLPTGNERKRLANRWYRDLLDVDEPPRDVCRDNHRYANDKGSDQDVAWQEVMSILILAEKGC